MTNPVIEAMARQIADAYGDKYDNAFMHKSHWIVERGESGGRFRDINEPFQCDYIEMAASALKALEENITDEMLEAGKEELFGSVEDDWALDAKRIFTAMLKAARGES